MGHARSTSSCSCGFMEDRTNAKRNTTAVADEDYPLITIVLLQVVNLSCDRLANAPSSCEPVVYYQEGYLEMLEVAWKFNDGSMPSRPLPHTDQNPLNRTEASGRAHFATLGSKQEVQVSNTEMVPLLYFFGGQSCHITFRNVTIQKTGHGLEQASHRWCMHHTTCMWMRICINVGRLKRVRHLLSQT